MFLISKNYIPNKHRFKHHLKISNVNIYTNVDIIENSLNPLKWILIGYILPKTRSLSEKTNSPSELLLSLYEKYQVEYYTHIKGDFILIEILPSGIKFFSDPFAIRKFFFYEDENDYFISNNFKEISKNIKLIPSSLNMTYYSLNYHFTSGRTIFEGVFHNQPGEYIELQGNKIIRNYSWKPEYLLNKPKKNLRIEDISSKLKDAVFSTLPPKKSISLSLTGGADTRNLLAIFLSMGIRPHLYTYGNAKSADCIKSSTIARGLGLEHSVHSIQMNPDLFEKYARKIIRQEGGLASIHRVHRLLAVEREKEFADYMYLGTLGGEFIKGVSEDDYIVPAIVYQNWQRNKLTEKDALNYLLSKRIIYKPNLLDTLNDALFSEPFMNDNIIIRKHNALSYITAHLHDAQDVNMYRSSMNEVYTPFLDIDYLETVFSSPFSFNHKEIIKNKYLRKIQNPVYASHFIKATYPPLMKYKYSGEHKPSEVLFNKYSAAVIKTFRKRITKKYSANFPLTGWMESFVRKNLPACKDYPVLKETFDINQLEKDLTIEKHIPKESYWLKYTNPIMMRFILEEFTDE